MTNVEALKALYKALGGDESDVAEINTIADMIAEIATVAATATAPELPAVTAETNGSVLQVANGKWAIGTDEIQA